MTPVLRVSFAVLLLIATVYGQELGITVTNSLNFLVIDDVSFTPLPNGGDWQVIDKVPLDPYARLIAVRGNNIIPGTCSGIMIASFDSPRPIVSDRTWKCSNSPANGWQFFGFDDSSWEPAQEIALNGEIVTGCGWFILQDMPTTAYWIWTSAHQDGDQVVSCRGYTSVCDDGVCQNGATCQLNQPRMCVCPVRWGGTFCELPIDECASNPCQNFGECELDDSGYVCKCPIGYTGVHCETDTTDCASAPCQNGGTCSFDIDGGYTCSCVPGYSGLDCETDIDECASEPCLNDATCTDGVNSVTCDCVPGFTGVYCQIDINECASDPCQNAATCVDQVNGYMCNCHTGYTGANCETPIDGCASAPCQNGGTCTLNGPGGAVQCICPPGWAGQLCSASEDLCLDEPCRNGATCVMGEGDYECFCSEAFYGRHCENVRENCGTIMARSSFPALNFFTILCEINIVDHFNNLATPCSQLITGINYFNDSATIVALGGAFGCYPTRFPDEVQGACVPNYSPEATLGSCLSCTHMGVCIRFPDLKAKKLFPTKK